jgi:hypothetical protein
LSAASSSRISQHHSSCYCYFCSSSYSSSSNMTYRE